MKWPIWLVLCCSVALSNGVEQDFASSLSRRIERTSLKTTAYSVYLVWHRITQIPFFQSIIPLDNIQNFIPLFESIKIIYEFAESDSQMDISDHESIAFRREQFTGLCIFFEKLQTTWSRTDSECNDVADAIDVIEETSKKLITQLLKSHSKCNTEAKHNELRLRIKNIRKAALNNAQRIAVFDLLPVAEISRKSAVFLVQMTCHKLLSLRKIFLERRYDSDRRYSFTFTFNMINLFFELVDPRSSIDLVEYFQIANICNQISLHHDNINLYHMQRYEADSEEIYQKIAAENGQIIQLVQTLIYDFVQGYTAFGESYNELLLKSVHSRNDFQLARLLLSKKGQFINMIEPIVDVVAAIREKTQVLNSNYAEVQFHVACAYQFIIGVLDLIQKLLLVRDLNNSWEIPHKDTRDEIFKCCNEISSYMVSIECDVAEAQANVLKSPVELITLTNGNCGDVAKIFYRIIRILLIILSRLPIPAPLDAQFSQYVGLINDLIKNRELIDEDLIIL